jgi:hypothetical protein
MNTDPIRVPAPKKRVPVAPPGRRHTDRKNDYRRQPKHPKESPDDH